MRTTITFDPDVAAAIEHVRHARQIGVSEAVNDLVRAGLSQQEHRPSRPFEQRTSDMRARIDIANIAEALELLDGPAER